MFTITRDGQPVATNLNTEIQVLEWFHKHTSQSMDWMCQWEGYAVARVGRSEPHKISVKVWHDGKFHNVHFNEITRPVLSRLYKHNSDYYNPSAREWETLGQHRIG